MSKHYCRIFLQHILDWLELLLSVIINVIVSEKEAPVRIGRLETESPIVLGGMSIGLTKARLAGAVANEGGFGTIGGVGLGLSEGTRGHKQFLIASEATLRKEIRDALEYSDDGNIGVNLMVATTDYEQSVRVAVEEGAKYIVSGAGLPLALPEYVEKYRKSGQRTPELIPIVSSLKAAELIIRKWGRSGVTPSAIVVETPNSAGGHLGVTHAEDIGTEAFSLETVVPQLVEALKKQGLDIPVIAAGGIWDKDDIKRMLSPEIGARMVQMATRFLVTEECGGSQEFKERHINNTDPIVVVKSPVGMPGRAIENDFIRKVNAKEVIDLGPCVNCLRVCEKRDNPLASYCIMRALLNAHSGEDNGVYFSGSNGDRLRENLDVNTSAVKIMHELTTKDAEKTRY